MRAMMIDIVNPNIKRGGTPPRPIVMTDIITVPVTYQRGGYSLMDMLSNRSIENVLTAYNELKKH